MSQSQRPRVSDVRQVFRIIGECRDLGDDSAVWRAHLAARLKQYVGASVVLVGEIGGSGPNIMPTKMIEVGWESDEERGHFQRFLMDGGMQNCDVFQPSLGNMPGPMFTLCRTDHTSDAVWYNSIHYNEYLQYSGLDGRLSSWYFEQRNGKLVSNVIELHRGASDKQFTPRDREIIQMLHEELVPLLGRQLATADQPSPSQLPPRLQSVLNALLDGDGEKQIALRLGLSPASVHQYVNSIYRHFQVNSRSELLALWIRRYRSCEPPLS